MFMRGILGWDEWSLEVGARPNVPENFIVTEARAPRRRRRNVRPTEGW
jgi:hypothetical protein